MFSHISSILVIESSIGGRIFGHISIKPDTFLSLDSMIGKDDGMKLLHRILKFSLDLILPFGNNKFFKGEVHITGKLKLNFP